MEGKILGNRYELISKIGGGGMAIVYKAKCNLLNRYVAVKILRSEFINDTEFVKRFRIESQSAASLSHPNIVSIYDVGQEGDIQYIVMEYVDGITLKEYIDSEGIIEWREAINISIQICSAIENAHKNRIVHRDIKPHNILLTKDGVAKVTDFGIARAVTNTTITMVGSTIGSVHYFSPEQARGGFADEKSDLYSLGITMYEMSTGVLPFEGETPVAVALKHLQQQPRPPIDIEPNVPRGVNDIILKAIRKEQNARYQSAAEMTEDLYKVLRQPEGGFVRNVISEKASTKKVMAVGGRNSYGEDNDGFYGTSAHRDIGNYNMDDLSNVNATNGNPYNKYNNYDDMPPYGPGNRMRTGYNGNDKNKIIKRNVLIAAGIISLLVIAIIIGFVRANSKNEKEGYYTMESFVNQDINEVLEKLKAKSWDTNMYVTVDKVNSDKPKDEVIEQSWKAGQELEINKDTINFKVSNGEKAIEKIEIPDDLVGEDYHDVEDRLKELGFTSIRTEGEAAEYKKDLVTRIEPEPGEKLEPNEEITIYYSLGKEETKKISVPNLINYTKDDAQAMLYSMGLKVGTLTPNDAPGDAKVIAQNPKVGVQVDENYEVDLTFEVASPSPSPSPSPQKVFKVINLREEHFQGSGPYNVEIIATAQDGSENFQQNYGPYNSFGDVPNNGRLRIQVNKNVPYNIEVKVNGVVVMNGT